MNALQLADWVERHWISATDTEVAAMLRKQHEAIKQLREACQSVVIAFDALPNDNEARESNLQINQLRKSLAATEEWK